MINELAEPASIKGSDDLGYATIGVNQVIGDGGLVEVHVIAVISSEITQAVLSDWDFESPICANHPDTWEH
jgi:hypothetical protein